jgi:anti-sigma B factor antagonist
VGARRPTEGHVVEFSITTRRLPGGVVEIVPHGEIDLETAPELRGAVDAAFAADLPTLIRIDLRDVAFVDSVGISALVGSYHTAKVRGTRLTVTEPSEFVYKQLYISGVVGLFGAPRPRTASAGDRAEPVG